MMLKDYVIFYPFCGDNSYINNMKRCWRSFYKIIDWNKADDNLFLLVHTKAIVLNWLESNLTLDHKKKLLYYKLLGIRIIWVYHNRMPHSTVAEPDQIKLARKNMRFIADISDAIIIHSQHSRKYLTEWTKNRKKVFYVPHIDYESQYRWKREEPDSDDNSFVFIFQGQIAPYKNIELLIRAFTELNLPYCKLRIAGRSYSTEYEEKIRGLCKNKNISLRLEYLSDYDVGEEIRKGNVMVLPYDLKSSMNSGAMLTAFSNKRPVIVSNNAMSQDYGKEDFLYVYDYMDEMDHCEKLKKMMKKAYENGVAINREKGQKAYEYTRKHNNDTLVIQSLKKIIDFI